MMGANWGDGRIVGRVGVVETRSWKAIVCYAAPGSTEETRQTNKEVWQWVRKEVDRSSGRQMVVILTDANGRVGKGGRTQIDTIYDFWGESEREED